jgi:hypothetical protein
MFWTILLLVFIVVSVCSAIEDAQAAKVYRDSHLRSVESERKNAEMRAARNALIGYMRPVSTVKVTKAELLARIEE